MKKALLSFALIAISYNTYGSPTITISALPTAEFEDNLVCYDSSSGKLGRCGRTASSDMLPVGVDGDGKEIGIYVSSGGHSLSLVSFSGYTFTVDKQGKALSFQDQLKIIFEDELCQGAPLMSEVGVLITANDSLYFIPKLAQKIDTSGKTYYGLDWEWTCAETDVSTIDLYSSLPNDVDETSVQDNYITPVHWKMRNGDIEQP